MGDRAFESIERAVRNLCLERSIAPGVSVALTDREQTLHVAGIGHADPVARIRVEPGHLFQIGSISKSFTAIALLREWEAGRLDLHAPVTEYLPWFEVRSRFAPITVHHLLTHTAGIVSGMDFTGEGAHEVWALRETDTGWAAGDRYLYSNAGYKALGLILEAVAGQPWWDVVRARVIEPLGMGNTEPVITHDVRRRLAVGQTAFYDDRPWHSSHGVVPAPWLESGTADGTICSTAADMAGYVRMLLNGGEGPSGRLIARESYGLLVQRAVEVADEPGAFYGYALLTRERHGHVLIGHSGGMVGFTALILADVDSGFGVVLLLNGSGERLEAGVHAIETLEAEAADRALPPVPPVPDPARIEGAADYAGVYRSGERILAVRAEGDRLLVERRGERAGLERVAGPDAFIAPHPDLDRFVLRFGREGADGRGGGQVVEIFHGPDWYVNDRYAGPTSFEHPPEWDAYAGHYRSHNPWASNFRVVVRKGRLWLTGAFAEEHADGELRALADASFRVLAADGSPSRIRFDTMIDGRATRAILDCAPYYRTFTP